MVTLVTNTTENKDCSDLWVNFTCISSEANPPVYNYLLSDDEDGFSLSESGTWVKKISRGGKAIYNCLAYHLVGNVTSKNTIALTVNGKYFNFVKQQLKSTSYIAINIICTSSFTAVVQLLFAKYSHNYIFSLANSISVSIHLFLFHSITLQS